MNAHLIKLLIVVIWTVQLGCEVYNDRPKIKTLDGNLILLPAYGKNVIIRPNGPKSSIFVGDQDLMLNVDNNKYEKTSNVDLQNNDGKLQDLQHRIENLESQIHQLSNMYLNITILSRRINTLTKRVRRLQNSVGDKSVDECQSHPCENGGTCLNLVNGYYCLCPSTWKGKNCDDDVNECRNYAGSDLGCQNGATCINRPGSYECICRPGWYGLDCTRKIRDCSGGDYEMCGHGSCIPVTTGEGIKCICDQGWTTNGTGITCLTDINECAPGQGARCSVNPKVECINLPGAFQCERCPVGYDGDGFACYDIDECLTNPNGGCSTSPMVSCHNTIGSRICGPCPPGYQGNGETCNWRGSCSINHGGCHPSAQCIDSSIVSGQLVQCICPDGMTGDGFGTRGCYVKAKDNVTQSCDPNPCGLHGHCHSLRDGYTCICYQGYSGMHCDKLNNFCQRNPCLNGGTCRPDNKNIRGFRCECNALHSGDLCQLTAQPCGGVLDAKEGSIIYPLSNSTYRHNSRCAWVIHTTPDKVINVTFSRFNLEYDPECQYDFVQIHDGRSSASQLIGRFCGNIFPKGGNIVSSHNNLYFWFRSDQSVARDGFTLHWISEPPRCGGELNASTHGHLSSPGSPGKYPPNRDCYWHLTTTLGKKIQLHFFQLDIEIHSNCSFDYLAIYDGEHSYDPLLSKYCNSTQPPPLESAGSDMLIHFHSDEYGNGYGFQIAYAPIEGIPGCGGLFTNQKGEIISPSYDGSYLNNLLCEYKIKTRQDTKIRIEFKTFNLERSLRCRYDHLKVYDGASSESRLVGTFCGKTLPKSFISTSNTIFIVFKSDHSLTSGGFKLKYESTCLKNIMGDSGIIISPGYPITYPKSTVCEYVIGTNPGKAIQLAFQDFDIEDNRYYNCKYDHVEIRDGHTANATLMGRFCGGSDYTPPVQISTHNYMYIKFNSDRSITGRGFYANFTTIDTECGGIYKENNGIINHPKLSTSQYGNDQTCTWLVLAPEGMHIKVSWGRFDLETMTSCNSDYVELIELDNNNTNSTIGKYCGEAIPPALTTSSNRIMIRFVSDSSVRSSGFSLSYSFLDEKTHCGGLYAKTHGYIFSPGWPDVYEPNRDCTWIITVPIGQRIMLNITKFDLERPLREKCDLGDYLILRDGINQNSPIIGKYCGSFKWKRIVSTSNSIFLNFHSDFYLTGKGFQIEWDGTLRGCGGTLTSVKGSIASPNYPQNYNENAECFYKIVTNSGSRIRITFTDLDLERTSDCKDDYVEIFDGRDIKSPSYGRHCFLQNTINNFVTTTNYAYIKFRSDVLIVSKGFLLSYDTICNNNVTGSYGVIESPGFPSKYSFDTACLWTINVLKGHTINITFTHFDVLTLYRSYRPWLHVSNLRRINTSTYTHQQCESDNIQYKETSDANFSKKICGSTLPAPINSKTNSFQIKFTTGVYFPRTGFRLEWSSYGCGGHIQKQSGSLNLEKIRNVPSELECDWIIETPPGSAASITITELHMEESKNCIIDSVTIYNGHNSDFPVLTKFCDGGKTKVQASSNFMLVKLIKQSTLGDIHYESNFDSISSGCGGRIESKSGFIYSQNYPKNYENNLDCTWLISVPKHHKIEINFIDLDLYSDYEDDNEEDCQDSIKIYNGLNLLQNNYSYIICPKSNRSHFISEDSDITIQFVTNSEGTAKGFKASFSMICGATIYAVNDGIISNHNSIQHTNTSCMWTILAQNSDKIKLTIQHMSLPRNTNLITNRHCPSSFLRVFDGVDDKSPLIQEYCGYKVPPAIVTRGSALTVQLGTYSDLILGQFEAHYSTLITACGGSLTSEEGSIASPNYPLSYPINSDCEWTLSTSPGNRVYVTFENFDLEYSEGCNEDYLEVREDNGGGKLLAVYCGHDVPSNVTTGTKLYIKFHSDNLNTGRGFLLHYGFLHGNDIIGLQSGEITSPLYPHSYENKGDYTWRVTTSALKTINLIVDLLEIKRNGNLCSNKLIIYDGYDEEAPILEEMCGIIKNQDAKTFKTSSSVMFIKLSLDETNKGSLFHLKWADSDRNIDETDKTNKITCGSNFTQTVSFNRHVTVASPNYPHEYDSDSYCEWLFQTEDGRHLSIQFNDLVMEETSNCFADYISIYSSDTQLQWTPLKESICLSENVDQKFEAAKFMKVIFKSDSSLTRKGFQGTVKSKCGGLILNNAGLIEPLPNEIKSSTSQQICDWIVKVRAGRTIKIYFEHFNITNSDSCDTYVFLKNGASNESPLIGKYCGYSRENRTDIVTSGNYVFVRYVVKPLLHVFQDFRLRYEEMNIECGATPLLDVDHPWEIISSPNYPSVPVPYTECIWKFTAPPGEILRVDFIDRFDLETSENCDLESVELRDGSTILSPLKGTFCKERPSTVKTSSNTLFVKYSTQLAEPRNGFKANISIDICGGTIISRLGEITSPNYPHMPILPAGTVCKWQIVSTPRHVIKIQIKDINLPESEDPCGTKITIEESIASNGTVGVAVLKSICENDFNDLNSYLETVTNTVVIKLHIGTPSAWGPMAESRGFKISFNSSRPYCGGTITASEGFVTTPGYPLQTSIRFCQWFIIVPNKNRRVRLEIIDMTDDQNFAAYNDNTFSSGIDEYSDSRQTSRIYESSGYRLSFYIWMKPSKATHRFKAAFSSSEAAFCGGSLSGMSGELKSPDSNRSYVCEWDFKMDSDESDKNAVNVYNSIYITVNLSSSEETRIICGYSVSRLNFISTIHEGRSFIRNLCGNKTQESVRIPIPMMNVKAVQFKRDPLYFNMKWKLQPCGGVIYASKESVNILKIPEYFNDTIECSWALMSLHNERVELKLEGTFSNDCSNEYLLISEGYSKNSIAYYCKDKIPEKVLTSSYIYTSIQYHSKAYNGTNIKLMAKSSNVQCGGHLSIFIKVFTSPNYPKVYQENQECTWEIKAEVGYRVTLQFTERFVIEDAVNCTKDALIIYDWINNDYQELVRLCGRNLPPQINSTFHRMKVVFRSDATINLDGFKAQWSPTCGGNFFATDKEQTLLSPGYDYGYQPYLRCEYNISAPSKKLLIKFLDFELEGPYPNCKYDNLTITASNDYNYLQNTYCGKELPNTLSSFESVNLMFKTDRFAQKKGFKLAYSIFSCGGKITEPKLLTFDSDDTYGDYKNCTWTVETSIHKIITLSIIHLDIESSYDCFSDSFSVYDGSTINPDKRLALLCGHSNTTSIIRSTGTTAIIQFISEAYYNSKGFQVKINFGYSQSFGCGGSINLTETSTHTLRSPFFNNKFVYDNYLDCHWSIKAPKDYFLKVKFSSFHIAPCLNVNQTALGANKCDCDFVEILDGLNPNSLVIGKYCGHNMPPELISSGNIMGIRLSTDGDITSSGFEALISFHPSVCGQTDHTISYSIQQVRSPGYNASNLLRGLHCAYYFESSSEPYSTVHFSIRNLDLEPEINGQCTLDKLVIYNNGKTKNMSVGKDFIWNDEDNVLINYAHFYDSTLRFPKQLIFCGRKKSLDFYFSGSINVNLITSPEAIFSHKGVEIEVSYINFCGRNYSEPQGRLQSNLGASEISSANDCFVSISAPENHTISVYFLSFSPIPWNSDVYIEFFDGNSTKAPLLYKSTNDLSNYQTIFSNGQYLLLHNHKNGTDWTSFDLIYIITDKGKGCGGNMSTEFGRVTSPLYPDIYRRKGSCEWELETPVGTYLRLHFTVFDLGRVCNQNYLSLVDRKGNTISTYCSETPADYTSKDNYLKIVFTTTSNNGGTGWIADFAGTW